MKLIHSSKIFDLAVAGFCIMALLIGAASAAGAGGAGGNNPPAQVNGIERYTMDQTLSDQGQQATIAFDALAFVTGDSCSDTFLPPGKVADYAGFQYLRDNDATQMGHNTDFVTRISDNVLSIMTDDQLKQFTALSETEAPLSTQFGYMRYPLAKAFRAQLDGTIPSGSSGLDKAAVMAYSAKLYDVDASISIARAKTYASVIRSMTPTQLAYLDKMKSTGMASMPVVDSSAALKNAGQGNSVAMRTYASEMFAWYAGSVDADVYFCPERQATYFGSFYMKDAPAMGNAGYSISTSLTGDSGANFLNLLTADQRAKVTGLVDLQRSDLNEIVAKRTAISTELRKALAGSTIDEATVRAFSARYGELDGEISWYYATHFADVGKTLTSDQKAKAVALRNLAGYTCQGGYLYSQPIAYPQDVPSDFLFGIGTYDSARMAAWVADQQTTTLQTGPGTGGQKQRSVTGQGKGDGAGAGNATCQEKGNGPRGGAGNQTNQSTGQGQQNRMPVEDVIARLELKGYDVSGVKIAVQSGDHEAMKVWMGEFKKNNPGVAEAIEGIGTKTSQPGNTGPASPPDRPSGQTKTSAEDTEGSPFITWLADLWRSLWAGGSTAKVSAPQAPALQTFTAPNLGERVPQTETPPATEVPAVIIPATNAGTFSLTSTAGPDGGTLPSEYSCSGAGVTPALSWSGAPADTKEFALMVTTIPVDGATRWNWVLYGIPASTTSLAPNSHGVGTVGTGSHGTVMQYDPPCPQGPGSKTYTFTLYALSASPSLPASADQVTGEVLTSAIAPVTLGTAAFNLSYAQS